MGYGSILTQVIWSWMSRHVESNLRDILRSILMIAISKNNKKKGLVFISLILLGVAIIVLLSRHQQQVRMWEMPEHFSRIGRVSDGLAVVEHGQRRGIIDLNQQKVVFPFARYRGAIIFERVDDFLRIQIGEESVGIICIESTEEVISFDIYSSIALFPNGMAIVSYKETQGLIDVIHGEELIPTGIYDRVFFYNDEVAIVELDRSQGLIDLSSGEKLIPIGEFSRIGQFYNGIATVATRQIDTSFNDSLAHLPCWYEYCFDENCLTIYDCYHHCSYCHSCHYTTYHIWGAIHVENGEQIIPFEQYDQFIGPVLNGMVVAKKDDAYALIELTSGLEQLSIEGAYSKITLYEYEAEALALVIKDSRRVKVIALETFEERISLDESSNLLLYDDIEIDSSKGLIVVTAQDWSLGFICLYTWEELIRPIDGWRTWVRDTSNDEIFVFGSYSLHAVQRSGGNLVNTVVNTGTGRRVGGTLNNFNRVVPLSNGMAAGHIIWDYGDDRRAEFQIINLATDDIILSQPASGGICQIFSRLGPGPGEYFPYADGFLVIRDTDENNDTNRQGLIETRTGREIIPISDDGPEQIRILPNGFVALRHGDQWRIEQIESF